MPVPLRLLDLCTGTMCIPLLFHHEFFARDAHAGTALDMVAVDISASALSLSRENLRDHRGSAESACGADSSRGRALCDATVLEADVLRVDADGPREGPPSVIAALQQLYRTSTIPSFQILTANPPYIPRKAFRSTTSRSVRRYEPELALVPRTVTAAGEDEDGDVFYPRLLDIAIQVNAKIVLLEVADMEQALRVATMVAVRSVWKTIEIWRDEPSAESGSGNEASCLEGAQVNVRGRGNGRSVFASNCD